MTAEQLIHKATLVLDLRGDTEKAEDCLRQALRQAEEKGPTRVAVQAAVFLGELLIELDRGDEGRPLLERALELGATPDFEPDLTEQELTRARELLARG